jgi:multicomponent Na+:H+ antiporter subunit A
MPLILLLHALVGVITIAVGDRLRRGALLLAAVPPVVTLAYAASVAGAVLDGRPVVSSLSWVPGLDLAFDLRIDAFSLLMIVVVSGIGLLVIAYAASYFAHPGPGTVRLIGLLSLFAGAMLGVVVADHLLALFVFWELTSITSYLLIGNDDTSPRARASALQALLVTGTGGLFLLAGLIIVGQAAGTYRLSELAASPPSGGAVGAGLVFILIGCLTKSAQIPFGGWLPAAMVAPTPVSAYLHSATMVKAGVYLIARLSPIVAAAALWRPVALTAGAVTILFGGWRALRQNDLKLILAFGTVSQLGLLVVLFATGDASVAQAGVVLLLAHAVFKAALFMVVGVIDHQTGTRDVRALHGFGRGWRPLVAVAVIAASSMAGLPPLLGFIAKEKALAGLLHGSFPGAQAVVACVIAGSVLTVAYSGRFVLGVLGRLGDDERRRTAHDAPPPPLVFVAPAALLAAIAAIAGLAPVTVDRLVRAATTALHPAAKAKQVVLWAGFNDALVWSAVVIACGLGLVLAHAAVARIQRRTFRVVQRVPTSEAVFAGAVKGLTTGASRTISVVQSGSLPIYLGIVLLTVVGVPLIPFVRELDSLPPFVDVPIQIGLAVLIAGAVIGACVTHHRMAAALLLGAVGYVMAGFYVVHGAPDLALTQLAIETLSTVLFVIVLRFLPEQWSHRSPPGGQRWRLALAALVGVAVFVFAIVASNARDQVVAEPISTEMVQRSLPDGKGRNVVNVILVDFRGYDTLGEIAVLLVAALGAVGLAGTGLRRKRSATEVAS